MTVLVCERACVCVRVCVETRRCTARLFGHKRLETWKTVQWPWEPHPHPGSLCGISHNATPGKGRRPRSQIGSDSRGCLSLTCVVAPVSAPVSLNSCHLTASGPRHLTWFMPGSGPWRYLSTLVVCACTHMYIPYMRACGRPWR